MKKKKWTKEDIPDLTGKVIIVTGGNSSLGFESVKAFARNGAEVILACRSVEKGEKAKADIGPTKGDTVVIQLDLMDFDSIKRFARLFQEKYDRLDVLLNNAGIMTSPYFLTKDGLEAQNGTNHFGHFALTGHLIEIIIKTPGSRVVNVSSLRHKWGKMDFDNPLYENGKDYSPAKSYARSKLSNLLFTYELQRRFEKNHIDSMAVAAHPGVAATNLVRYVENKFLYKLLKPLFLAIAQNQDQGALPEIRASVDPEVKGGEYYGPDGFAENKGYPVKVTSNKVSHSMEDAKKLWELSGKITNVQFL